MSTEADTTVPKDEDKKRKIEDVESSENESKSEQKKDETKDIDAKKNKVADDENSAEQKSIESASSSVSAPAVAGFPLTVIELPTATMEVSHDKVGILIGARGMVIQDMQNKTMCKIYIKQDFPDGHPRQIIFTGTHEQIEKAQKLVRKVMEEGPTALHVVEGGPLGSEVMDCPQALVGRVIGGQGNTIRELQARSGARFQINQDMPEGMPRKIHITGTPECIQVAKQLVIFVMENGPNSLQMLPPAPPPVGVIPGATFGQPITSYGGSGSQIIDCAKAFVGRIIGKGGETITMIQQRSGAKLQIDQTCEPCKIQMAGSTQALSLASQIVYEILTNGPGKAATMQLVGTDGRPIQSPSPYGGGSGGYGPSGGMGGASGGYGAPNPYGPMGGAHANPYGPTGGGGYGAPQHNSYAPTAANSYGPVGGYNPYGPQSGQGAGGGYGGAGSAYGSPSAPSYGAPAGGAPTYGGYSSMQPIAPPPPKTASPWTEHRTDDGNVYWYNASTGISQWDRPANA